MKRILLVVCSLLLCSCQMELKGNKNTYFEKTEGLESVENSLDRLTFEEKAKLLSEEFLNQLGEVAHYENNEGMKSEFHLKYLIKTIVRMMEKEYEAVDYFEGEQWLSEPSGQWTLAISKEHHGYSLQGKNLKVGYKLEKSDFEELQKLFENFKLQGLLADYNDVYDYDGVLQTTSPFLDEEANEMFRKGFRAISLFVNGTLPRSSIAMKQEGFGVYYRTAEERFQYFEDFKAYLQEVFTPELIDTLLYGLEEDDFAPRYLNVNGYTSVAYEVEQSGPYEIMEYDLVSKEDNTVQFRITAQPSNEHGLIPNSSYQCLVTIVKEEAWRIRDFDVILDGA